MMANFNQLSTLIENESEEKEEISLNPDGFRLLCDSVETSLAEIDRSIFNLLEFKDKLLLQYLPSHVFLQFVLVFSRFYRSYSQSHVSINELIRLVQIYSQPFNSKCLILKKFYESNHTKRRLLNLALQKLSSLQNQETIFREQKCIDHWEKMYIRLALPRGNVKKWKFRMNTFREKAKLGYEHVLEWSQPKTHRMSLTSDIVLDEIETEDQFETVDEIVNHQQQEIEVLQEREEEINEPGLEENIVIDESNVEIIESVKPEAVYVDANLQVQPDCDDQQVSTEDSLFTKSILMRIYRPIGIAKNKFYCTVHTQGQTYTTKTFVLNKSNARLQKLKEHSDVRDPFKLDKQQTDELLIPMPTVLQRRSIFQTDVDPHAIQLDIFADETLTGSLILTSEDLRMLDLPNLYSPNVSPFIIPENEKISSNRLFNLDQPSTELYQSWISRTPQLFSIYNQENDTIGRLPMLLFWYSKTENRLATKSTMTLPIEIPRVPTPKIDVFVPTVTEKIIERTSNDDEQMEIVRTNYENEILRLHRAYQEEIQRLTNVINQMLSEKNIDSIEEVEEMYVSQENQLPPAPPPPTISHSSAKRLSPTIKHNRDLPKSFLDRYEMYIQRSIIHRHELASKVEQKTALQNERQMEVQHRLHKTTDNYNFDNDLCLPAVFMPFQSGNVINPRAYQYFHSIGSAAPRLTQAPSILKFPALPARSLSVLNLFELSQAYEKDH